MPRAVVFALAAWFSMACLVSAQVPQPVQTVEPVLALGEPVPAVAEDVAVGFAAATKCAVQYPYKVWAGGEYLLWWIRDSEVPALVTAGPVGGGQGILGARDTATLFGGDIDNGHRSGGRFWAGAWLDHSQKVGLECNYLFLASDTVTFDATCLDDGTTVLARPFVNADGLVADAQAVCFPGLATGTVHVSSASRLWGFEDNLLLKAFDHPCASLTLLGGFRYLELDEGLGIDELVTVDQGIPVLGGRTFAVSDQFDTRTRFYGGQLGARAEVRFASLFANVTGKVALGANDNMVRINGQTVTAHPSGLTTATPGGLLALNSNIGRYNQTRFAVVPELGVQAGCQLPLGLRAFVGYSFLFVSDAVRPGQQIDLTLNPQRIPTSTNFVPNSLPARPAFTMKDTGFWAQGVSFGMELRF